MNKMWLGTDGVNFVLMGSNSLKTGKSNVGQRTRNALITKAEKPQTAVKRCVIPVREKTSINLINGLCYPQRDHGCTYDLQPLKMSKGQATTKC